MKRSIVALTLLVITFTTIGAGQQPGRTRAAGSIPVEVQAAFGRLSKTALRAHMAFLADDLLEGRGTGTRGQEIAARYVAEEFEAAGLEPAGEGGSFFQRVPLRQISVDKTKTEMSLTRGGRPQALEWGVDFVAGGNAFSPDSVAEAPVVFAGYGVTAVNRQYDDYAGLEVRGKIVAVLSGAPEQFPSEERAHFSSGLEKAKTAGAHGAIGLITLRTPENEKILPWDRSVIGAELPSFRWVDANGNPADAVAALRGTATLSVKGAAALFVGAAHSFEDAQQNARNNHAGGFALDVSARIHNVSTHQAVTSPNVVGVLRGSEPTLRNEYVLYSAHTDHLGIGRPINGDAIYNGAVDDGTGVTALIETARSFATMAKRPARSIVFAAFTAEEKGLLGADYYAHHLTVPKAGVIAALNIDGASVFYTFNDIVALGVEHTTMADRLRRDAASLGLKLSPDPQPEQVGFIRNDQYPFVRVGIPALCIGEGFQAKDPKVDGRKFQEDWVATRYHAPNDDMSQPLNFDAMIQYMKISVLFGYDLLQGDRRPAWKSGDFFGGLASATQSR